MGSVKGSKKVMADKMTKNLMKSRILLAVVIVAVYVVFNFITGGLLLTGANLSHLFSGTVSSILMAWAMLFIFLPGIIDLSVGAIFILAANVGGIFAVNLNLGTFGLVVGAILTSIALLMLNTILRQALKIPSWIFGIGAMMVYEAIGMFYSSSMVSQGTQVVSLGDTAREISKMPWNIIVVVIGFLLAYLVLHKTSAGYNLQALGSNQIVAEHMGINVFKTLIYSAIIGGIFLGLAAAINLSAVNRVMPSLGLTSMQFIINALAGFLLASTLQKIVNLPFAIIISIFFISSIFNVLTILGVPSGTWQETTMGLVVILSGLVANRKFEGVVK